MIDPVVRRAAVVLVTAVLGGAGCTAPPETAQPTAPPPSTVLSSAVLASAVLSPAVPLPNSSARDSLPFGSPGSSPPSATLPPPLEPTGATTAGTGTGATAVEGDGAGSSVPWTAVPGTAASETAVPAATGGARIGAADAQGSATGDAGVEASLPSPPRRIVVPTIGVDASIVDLGLTADGALETPADFGQAGWWAGGTQADVEGPTVIVGHVDDYTGPAVFYRLSELEPGDLVVVIDDRGGRTDFVVVDKELYDKDSFPTERVYGPDDEPTLRLVTCGGDFDRAERSYEGNWVVYAVGR